MIIVSRFCDSRRRSRNYTGGGAGGRAQIFVQLRRVWFWIVVNTWINYKENKFGIVASDRLLTVVNRNRAIYSTNLHVRYVLMSVTKGYKGCTYLFVLSGEGGGRGRRGRFALSSFCLFKFIQFASRAKFSYVESNLFSDLSFATILSNIVGRTFKD